MAVKARSQLTILDSTDAFSANLSNDSYTFSGDTTKVASTQSFTTVVSGLCGTDTVTAAVNVSALTLPTGLTITSDNDSIAPTLTVTATTSLTAAILDSFGHSIDIPIDLKGGASSGGVTIHKSLNISIALKGSAGTAAYSVLCGNEAQVIACDKDGKTKAAGTITIPFSIFQGTSRKAATVTYSTLPSGITLNTNTPGTTSAEGSLVLDVASGSTLGGADSGTITLTFKTGSTTVGTKNFVWTKSLTGADGAQGGTGTAATSVVCGNEAVSIPCTLGGLVTAAQTIVIPFAGYIGTARAACTVTYSTLPSGITLATNGNKAATTSADGSLTFNVAKDGTLGGATVYTGDITLTFTCNGQTFVKKFTWSKAMTGATGAQGAKGDTGDDAIMIAIISSNGLVFKNNTGSTVLTAHVYKGGAEVTGSALTALGTLKWYKDGGSTAVGTGATLSVSAADVTNVASYEVMLEE